MEQNKILSKNQFGFRPGLRTGTENALYSATKFIYEELDNSNKFIAIFLDLAKAFDTVDHSELIKILLNFGLKNSSLNWLISYLEKRKQKVIINGTSGEKMVKNNGVPQGSVLSTILFILYINSICNIKIDGQIVTYADDTCLLFSGVSWDEVRLKSTYEFKKVITYLKQKKLSISYKKHVL